MASKPWKQNIDHGGNGAGRHDQERGEAEEEPVNPLAIVPSIGNPPSPPASSTDVSVSVSASGGIDDVEVVNQQAAAVSVRQVRKEEVESKISAWEAAELAKVHNRFKREEAIIIGWEDQEVEKASAWLRKIERKLDEEKARAVERMRNDVAVARQKAEEKRASVEAKRGEKLARVLELGKLMKIVGKSPSKRSFF